MIIGFLSGVKASQGIINPIYSDDCYLFNDSLNPKIVEHTSSETRFNGHHYELITISKTWSEAKADCESRGGYLVTITSQEENDFVSNLIGDYEIWIGLSDYENEGDWQWVTGEPVTYISYTNWGPDEPNDSGEGEDYAEMYGDGSWNDNGAPADPFLKHYYVCEWDYPHSITAPSITFPNGGETLKDTSTILWSASSDSYYHDVTYKVSYSLDNGNNWETLVSGLTTTSFEWDTSTITFGTSFLIKVIASCSGGMRADDISDGSFSVHYLTNPTLISPRHGNRLSAVSSLQWSESTDSLGYTVTYSIFYSTDNGNTWDPLVSGLTTNSYDWNTTNFADGRYKIKIKAIGSEGLTTEYIIEGTFFIDNIPTDITIFIVGLAIIMIVPELYLGRRLRNVLSRKRVETVKREEGVGQV
jgi:hypothetical protein